MKTLTLSALALLLFFISIAAIQSFSPANRDAVSAVLDYKNKNAVSCAPDGISQKMYEALPSYASLFSWRNTTTDTTYNTLCIPDTICGPDFTLRIHDTSKQYLYGAATATAAFNNHNILGPTLIFNKGATLQMHVKNDLTDTTTIHWHGMHLPAIMDGGPHQVVAPGTQWNPTWVVKNNAATYWYHPHVHGKTSEQLVKGLSGLIIVRDDAESALNLPRTYSVDDIPVILNDKRFDAATNQLVMSRFGDTMMCNGTLNAQYNIPAQVVRFRILCASPDRDYNLGFSDNRSFSVIAGDAGLLNNPVPVTRYIISPGERIEILVNFSGQQQQSVKLRAFNASLPSDVSGSEPNNGTTADFIRNVLGARDFDILKLNIVAPTANPVTAIPSSLIANIGLDSTQVNVTRALKITLAGNACPDPSTKCSWFNKQLFDMNRIDYKVNQDATEIWEITNSAPLAHPFHIHDVSFKILSKSNGPLEDYEKGWKDVVLVRKGATVRFIAKFSDYADSTHPYMYHCHISSHADEGMMGQFVVMPPSNTPPAISIADTKKTEGNSGTSQMNFTVSLSSPYTVAVTIKYKTKDATAVAASDYIAASGTLTFNAGETFKTISVAIIGDVSPEANETFKVTLSNPMNATIADGSAKGTITNDDGSMAAVGANKSNATINSDIKIFPNPVTNGLANISISRIYTKPLHVIITDANGRILSTQTIAANSNSYKADVSKLKDGIYFIAVLNGKTLLHKQTIQLMH